MLTEVALQFKETNGGGVNPVVWDAQAHGWVFIQDGEAWSWPIFSPGGRRPNKGTTPLTDARKGAITDGLTKAASMIGVGHEVFKGLVRPGQAPTQPGKATQPTKRVEPSAPEPGTTLAPAPKQPALAKPQTVAESVSGQPANGAGNGLPAPGVPAGFRNGKANGATADVSPAETGTGFRSGNGKPNGTNHAVTPADPGTGFRNGNGNGAVVTPASATTYWTLANQHSDRLDRTVVSALAKEIVTGKMSWLEVQTILHDMIEEGAMPVFGSVAAPRETSHEKANGAPVQYAEKVSDPLDELFA